MLQLVSLIEHITTSVHNKYILGFNQKNGSGHNHFSIILKIGGEEGKWRNYYQSGDLGMNVCYKVDSSKGTQKHDGGDVHLGNICSLSSNACFA